MYPVEQFSVPHGPQSNHIEETIVALALSAKIVTSVLTTLTNPLDLSTPADTLNVTKTIRLTSGTTASKADRIFHDYRTLATGATENLDLAGVLTDPLGNTLTFVTIKEILFIGDDTNTTILTIGNGTNPFVGPFGAGTHTHDLRPGGLYHAVAPATGWTVTAGTADIIKVTNASGADASYRVVLIGTSA
jgi:hypothetical protein